MKTIIFNDFFISTHLYVKTLFYIKYTKANEIKPFVLKSQLMFCRCAKNQKKITQKQKSLAKNTKISKYTQKLPKSFCKLKESKCHTPFLKPQTLQMPQTLPQTPLQTPPAF